MLVSRLVTISLAIGLLIISAASESFAGTKLYKGSWIAESFGNDRVGIGTLESQYFEVLGIPQGANCHPNAPLCPISSTPVTTAGAGTVFNPIGPGCRALTAGETPRPAKGDTLRPPNGKAAGAPQFGCPGPAPCTCSATANKFGPPCDKTPPLYRNSAFFTVGGAASNQTCTGAQTVLLGKTTAYLAPGDPKRGIAMKGAPVSGSANATTTGTSFKFPAALATPGPGNGMRRTDQGSFIGEGPYLYSYTYANLRNDAGSFGPGKGFFSTAAAPTTLVFDQQAGGTTVQKVTVKRGSNRFGGVMKLLGTYSNKVCYFYAGGCGLGYGTWGYQNVGAAGYKSGGVVTASYTTQFVQVYYNTAIATFAKYDVVEQRFPWTTGTVTLTATARGPNKTFEQRKGFDNRTGSGYGTVQLVSPLLTQWLAQSANAVKMETGGIAVMQIKFLPEPGGIASLIAGVSMLCVFGRLRR
ncbi:MAG: hypothetical protein JRG90_05375 [Deltaproteobacteria bacterium]|nr:hypothetical protein [Deltaproteobacteria bacterium]